MKNLESIQDQTKKLLQNVITGTSNNDQMREELAKMIE